MTYIDPPTLPNQPLPPFAYGQPRRRVWPWLAGIGSLLVVGLVVTVVLLLDGSGDGSTGSVRGTAIASPHGNLFPSAPEPISRAELMAEYAQIAPLDTSATPEAMDALARSACSALDGGNSTDLLISTGTEFYGANATKVMELLVSYKCPKYLKDFK